MQKLPRLLSVILWVVISGLVIIRTEVFVSPLRAHVEKEVEPADPILDAATQTLVERYDAFVRQRHQAEQFPGAAVVMVKDGRVIFSKGYGVRSLYSQDSVNTNTVFRLASLSKGFAAVLAGMLVQDGHFQWDDPVIKYVPEFRLRGTEQTEALSIRHVLSHTTGLPRQAYSNLIESGQSYRAARQQLREVRLTHSPGLHYNYQNVAYSLVGDVIEQSSQLRFEEQLYKRIFLPLGMRQAGAGYGNFMLDTSNVAWPHKYIKEAYQRIPVSRHYYELAPAAGVNASVEDMGAWLLFLLGHRPELMRREALETLFSQQIAVPLSEGNYSNYPLATEAWYGLGWRGVMSHGRKVIFHGGYVNGFRTEIAFIPTEDVGIAVLSNSPSGFINASMPKFLELYWGLTNEKS
jgi:beta-lactamase class C